MTRDDQRKFVDDLVTAVHKSLVTTLPNTPEYWDGIELRQLIADKFADVVISGTMDRKRAKEYRNEVLVRNLV